MRTDLVTAFCTPPFQAITDFDIKVLSEAEKIIIPFECETINCYSWGQGKTVLLAHGWGSRASHLALIARALSKSGFRVVAFDAPAHSSAENKTRKEQSNFFEYSRALSLVSNNFDPLYAIVGHSLGAASAVFAISGQSSLAHYKVDVEKLVLMGLPANIVSIVTSYCNNHNLNQMDWVQLKEGLEKSFNFLFSDFSVGSAIEEIGAHILLIHDAEDEEFPYEDVSKLHQSNSKLDMLTTHGSGHYKLVMNRQVVGKINEFLMS